MLLFVRVHRHRELVTRRIQEIQDDAEVWWTGRRYTAAHRRQQVCNDDVRQTHTADTLVIPHTMPRLSKGLTNISGTLVYFSRNRFIWLVQQLRTIIHKSQPNSLITLPFRSHHETFIRRSWYSVLPDLDVTISCHNGAGRHCDCFIASLAPFINIQTYLLTYLLYACFFHHRHENSITLTLKGG